MSVAGHEAMAQAEERRSSELEACTPAPFGATTGPCWTSRAHPTDESLREAEAHRRRAAEHRRAAVLRAAEERACIGVSEQDRVQSPFSHHADIANVQPLIARLADGRAREAGAIVVFREVPGLSVEWLQRVVDCHLARNAAFGFDVRELAYCPLSVNPLGFKKLEVSVTRRVDGFAVTLQSEDESVARELLRRARALAEGPKCLRALVLVEN